MKINTKKNLVHLICRQSLQPLMHKLYLFSVTGMNYGNANTLGHELTGEKKAFAYIKKKLVNKNELVIFDVGANEGNYALLLCNFLADKSIIIYAFEPSKHSYHLLTKNTSNIPSIRRFNVGLGNAVAMVKLYSNYEGSGATTMYGQAFEQYSFNRHVLEEIELQTLDAFCADGGIHTIDLLKIDVEGHELPVLEGGMQMVKKGAVKFIQFEFGPFHVYSRTFFKDFWDMLSPLYKIYRVITNGLFEIKTYNENLEIFRTANFLAELKQ